MIHVVEKAFLLLSLCAFHMLSGNARHVSYFSKSGIYLYQSNKDHLDKSIPVHYYIPEGDISKMTCQIILHGASRNADSYLDSWKEKADEYGLILLAPEFSKDQFPLSNYIEGMMLQDKQNLVLANYSLFDLLDDLFVEVNQNLELHKRQYNIFGHSAGGQFVHRFLLFHDSPYVNNAIAANPGWYTFPDITMDFPYGVKGIYSEDEKLRSTYYGKKMTILLGTADTLRGTSLRVTPEADAQGLNRLERGTNYFNENKKSALLHNSAFHWQLSFVPEAGHDHMLMSPEAADVLYKK